MNYLEKVVDIVDYYKIILIAFVVLLVVILVYIRGTKKNHSLVEEYMRIIGPVMSNNFSKF
jgi:hypothetical protein